jgi:hypothetical protein
MSICNSCEQPFDANDWCSRCEQYASEQPELKTLDQLNAEHPELLAERDAFRARLNAGLQAMCEREAALRAGIVRDLIFTMGRVAR